LDNRQLEEENANLKSQLNELKKNREQTDIMIKRKIEDDKNKS